MQNLKATAKSWEIVTLNKNGNSYPFNSKYIGWNFIVIKGSLGYSYQDDSRGKASYTLDVNSNSYNIYARAAENHGIVVRGTSTFSISGNNIIANRNENLSSEITVLFYK